MPKRPGDRHRVKAKLVRVPDDLWERFKRKAREEGRTVTEVLIRLIKRYLDEG